MTLAMKDFLLKPTPWAPIALGGGVADWISFYLLLRAGIPWNTAHLLSFAAGAALVYVLWNSDRSKALPGLPIRPPLIHYGGIQLLILFLRAGVLALFIEIFQWIPPWAIIPAIGSSIAGFRGALSLWRAPAEKFPDRWKRWALAIVIYAVLLRLLYSPTFELLHEEAYYWNYAQHLDFGYLDHPPLVGWLIWLFTVLLGHTEWTVRAGAGISWVLTAYYSSRLAREAFGSALALKVILLVATLPVFFCLGLFILPDTSLVACWAGALYYLYRALIQEDRRGWIGAGIFVGLGLLSKYTMALLLLPLIVFMILDGRARRWWLRIEPYGGALIALALFSPVIYWNHTHQWVSFYFQGPERWTSDYSFNFPHLIGSALLLITPTGVWLGLRALSMKRRILFSPADEAGSRTDRFLLMTAILPLSVFIFFSFFRTIKLIWTAPIWLGLLPYIGAWIGKKPLEWNPSVPTPVPRAATLSLYSLLLFYGLAFHYLVLGLPGVPYFTTGLGTGMKELARQVDAIEAQSIRERGEKPFFVCVDSDRLAGWIAFYRTQSNPSPIGEWRSRFVQNLTGGHLFGENSHMYRFWHPIESFRHQTLCLIGTNRSDLLHRRVGGRVLFLSEIESRSFYKNGKLAGRLSCQWAKMR